MKKFNKKKFIGSVLTVGVIGITAAPMTASAHSGYQYTNANWNWYNHSNRDRTVNRQEARDIAQAIFPNRTIQDITRQNNNGNGVVEFRVRFTDGTRVDVRQSNGRVTYVRSSLAINENQARRIGEAVFPNKTVRDVVRRDVNGVDAFRVRFTDGSRVDLRVSNGMILDRVNGNNT